ncbi:MAG: hypothetical protein ACI8UD_003234, partial [Planctomycetota bacterium]
SVTVCSISRQPLSSKQPSRASDLIPRIGQRSAVAIGDLEPIN